MEKSKVYFIKEISPESLIKIYDALGRELKGKVAVKISTGEPGGHNFLNPNLIKDLVHKLNGTIVECNTAIVGNHLKNYDSILILSHFKVHAMGGFGGALKNMSIGIGSSNGKANIHTAGKVKTPEELWDNLPEQDHFLESMADACKGVMDYIGRENIAYINVANNLSVDCDCDSNPHTPEMKDLGIFASLDPVALDQACYDAVINSDDPGKAALIERMNSRHGIRAVEAANELGLGNREYEIINF